VDKTNYAGPVVELTQVCKSFNVGKPNEIEILHNIHLQLDRGEFCAVMGPSGSGKSTLLNIIGLLDRPTQGLLTLNGEETTQLDDHALTRLRGHAIGFVFQHHHLLSAFTALENVMMPMMGSHGRCTPDITERAMSLLDSVDLLPMQHQPSGSMSGGQQQRVAVARALAMSPALLLADEPTGNLDTKSADAVFDLLRRVSREQGTSVLFVTHNPELAERCDKTIQVVDGRVLAA
jgi:lipoprotein-releasing system ATP-binding protein